jgi:hypothetical protein
MEQELSPGKAGGFTVAGRSKGPDRNGEKQNNVNIRAGRRKIRFRTGKPPKHCIL